MAQTQLAELIYAENIDNSAGAQFDQTLVIIDVTVQTEPKVTMADGSKSALSDFFAKQLKLTFQKTAYNYPDDVFKALLSIQTVTNVATPALTVTGGPTIFQCAVTIPAGYIGSFLWGMTPSIAGGWALPGGAGAGGGGGGTPVTVASQDMVEVTIAAGAGPSLIGSIGGLPITGPTGAGHFTSTFTLNNPGLAAVNVNCTFQRAGDPPKVQTSVDIPASSSVSVTLSAIDAGFGIGDSFETQIEVFGAPGDSVVANPVATPTLGVTSVTVVG